MKQLNKLYGYNVKDSCFKNVDADYLVRSSLRVNKRINEFLFFTHLFVYKTNVNVNNSQSIFKSNFAQINNIIKLYRRSMNREFNPYGVQVLFVQTPA